MHSRIEICIYNKGKLFGDRSEQWNYLSIKDLETYN